MKRTTPTVRMAAHGRRARGIFLRIAAARAKSTEAAIAKRRAAAKKVGTASTPILIASQVDPQIPQSRTKVPASDARRFTAGEVASAG